MKSHGYTDAQDMGNFLSPVLCRPAIRPLPLNTGSTALGQPLSGHHTDRGQSLHIVTGDKTEESEKREIEIVIQK